MEELEMEDRNEERATSGVHGSYEAEAGTPRWRRHQVDIEESVNEVTNRTV
ncbi:unnamed protein product, partial [Linum tenue]